MLPGYDSWLNKPYQDACESEYPDDLTDEEIEEIERRNELCRGCRRRQCSECEV